MKKNKLKSSIRKFTPQKRRAVAEVISSLLLVAITVVGAVILTTFLDETFVSGAMSVTSSTDSTLKTIKLRAFDTRDGDNLFGFVDLSNDNVVPSDGFLCRNGIDSGGCNTAPDNTRPFDGGTEYLVIQIENKGQNTIWLSDVNLDNVGHVWDPQTSNAPFFPDNDPGTGDVPRDGMFSIISLDDLTTQNQDTQIEGGQTVNLVLKLDSVNDDIPLSKTIQVKLNIGTNTLQDFLIESGGAQ